MANTTIAAFSIDEHLRWATARIVGREIDPVSVTFGQEVEPTEPGVIAGQLTDYVARISAKYPDVRHAQGIGISMIGPVDVEAKEVKRVARKDWTPKIPGDPIIRFKNVFAAQKRGLANARLAVQNDATCGALAEWYFRENPRTEDLGLWVYITINEGVNCGVLNVSRPLFQYRHAEIGHVFPARHPKDPFDPEKHSSCPLHLWCFEGIASGASMRKRWGDDWSADPRAWNLEAFYVGQLCLTAMLGFRPDRLVLGGYVVHRNPEFLPMVRAAFAALNNGYIEDGKAENPATYISAGQFDDRVNVLGALVLALDAAVGGPRSVVDRSTTES